MNTHMFLPRENKNEYFVMKKHIISSLGTYNIHFHGDKKK